MPAAQFGWYFGAGAASFITVSQVNRRMVARHGVRRVLGWGVYGLAAGATLLLACAASGLFGFAGVFIPIFVMIGSIGFIASNASSVAMAPFGERAGAAASLLGATQSAFGVAASAAVGWVGNRGRKLRIEAFSIRPLESLAAVDIELKGYLPGGNETQWVHGGILCGTRGRRMPLIGFAVRLAPRLADRFEVTYQGSFFASGISGVQRNGEPCRSTTGDDPLEAINIRIVERLPEKTNPAG